MRIALVVLLGLAATAARADVIIPHVGRLVRANSGADQAMNGAGKLKFGLYRQSVDAAGQDNLVWEDTYESVVFDEGVYHVDLGEKTPITINDFAGLTSLWLEVTVFDEGASTGVKLSPRLRLEAGAVAHFATNAGKLGGKDPADYVLASDFAAFKADLTGGSSGGLSVPWAKVANVPDGFADGTDDGLRQVTATGALSGLGTGESPLAIAAGSVDTSLLKDGAVTAAKIAPNTITPDLFQAGSVGLDKLSQDRSAASCTDGAVLKLGASGWTCGSDVGSGNTLPFGVAEPLAQQTSGNTATLILKDNGIPTGKLADGAVTAAKLASDAGALAKVTGGAANAVGGNVGLGTATPVARLDVQPAAPIDGVGMFSVPQNSVVATITGGTVNTQVLVGDVVTFGSAGSRLVVATTATTLTYALPVLSTTTSYATLTFKITRQTARIGSLNIAADGAIGVNTATPSFAQLQFANGLGNRIGFWDNGVADRFGFGLNNSNLTAFVPNNARFSVRQNDYNGTEVFTVGGTGNVGITGDLAVTGKISGAPLATVLVELPSKVTIPPGQTVAVVAPGTGGTNQLRCPNVYNAAGGSAVQGIAYMLRVNVQGDNDATQSASIHVNQYQYGSGSWQRTLSNWTVYGRDWGDNYQDTNLSDRVPNQQFGLSGLQVVNNSTTKYVEVFAAGCVAYAQ